MLLNVLRVGIILVFARFKWSHMWKAYVVNLSRCTDRKLDLLRGAARPLRGLMCCQWEGLKKARTPKRSQKGTVSKEMLPAHTCGFRSDNMCFVMGGTCLRKRRKS